MGLLEQGTERGRAGGGAGVGGKRVSDLPCKRHL